MRNVLFLVVLIVIFYKFCNFRAGHETVRTVSEVSVERKQFETADEYLKHGDALEANGKNELALAAYTDAIRLNPQLTEAYTARARVYGKLQRHQEVIADLSKAIELNPKHPDARLNRAIAYSLAGQLDQSITALNELLKETPDAVEVLLNRGIAYSKKGELQSAITDYNRVLSQQLERSLRVQTFLNRGVAYAKGNHFKAAIKDFSQALELTQGQMTEARYQRAFAYRDKGNYAASIADFNELIEQGAGNELVYHGRGLSMLGVGDYKGAISDFTQALSLSKRGASGDADTYYYRGIAYQKHGLPEKAKADFEQCLRTTTDASFKEKAEQSLLSLARIN